MSKEELVSAIARGRAAIAQDFAGLRAELDVPAKLSERVRRNPTLWMGGAVAVGWILAGPKTKTRTVTKVAKPDGRTVTRERKTRLGLLGIALAIGRFAYPLIQPALSEYAGQQLAESLKRRRRS